MPAASGGMLAAGPAGAGVATEGAAALEKSIPYAIARLHIMQNGWDPAPSDPAAGDGRRCGARVETCREYPETEACSGTGMDFCAFRFSIRAGDVLTVTTSSETLPDLEVHWKTERP